MLYPFIYCSINQLACSIMTTALCGRAEAGGGPGTMLCGWGAVPIVTGFGDGTPVARCCAWCAVDLCSLDQLLYFARLATIGYLRA